VAQLFSLGIVYMRVSQYIIASIVTAILAVGCSTGSYPTPSGSFHGYIVNTNGIYGANILTNGSIGAIMTFSNPGAYPLLCRVQMEPSVSSEYRFISIPPKCTAYSLMMPVENTNVSALVLTVMRVTPVGQVSIPMQ
jgi:hypothetical protein